MRCTATHCRLRAILCLVIDEPHTPFEGVSTGGERIGTYPNHEFQRRHYNRLNSHYGKA